MSLEVAPDGTVQMPNPVSRSWPPPQVPDETILEHHGWTMECESPFEIRHEDGSFASGQAAEIVLEWCRENNPDESF